MAAKSHVNHLWRQVATCIGAVALAVMVVVRVHASTAACWTKHMIGIGDAHGLVREQHFCGISRGFWLGGWTFYQHQVHCQASKSADVGTDRFKALVTLGLDPSSKPSQTAIKRAFRREVLKSHPDVGGEGSAARFYAVKASYELLTGRAIATPSAKVRQNSKTPVYYQEQANSGPSEEELREVWAEVGYNPYCNGDQPELQDLQQDDWQATSTSTNNDAGDVGDPLRQKRKPGQVFVTEPRRTVQKQEPSKTVQTLPPYLLIIFLALLLLLVGAQRLQTPSNNLSRVQSTSAIAPDAASRGASVQVIPERQAVIPTAELDYELAASVAEDNNSPVLLANIKATLAQMRGWLLEDEQQQYQALFSVRGVRANNELQWAEEERLEQLWDQQGRSRLFVDGMLAALREAKQLEQGEARRFNFVMAVVRSGLEKTITQALMNSEDMQLVDVDSGRLRQSGDPFNSVLSGRCVVRLRQPVTGQELVLIGAQQGEQAFFARGFATKAGFLRAAIPDLSKMTKQVHPDLVIFDLSRPAWVELEDSFSQALGINNLEQRSGLRLLELGQLNAFMRPEWWSLE